MTDAACASTFSAISMAAQELYLGDSDVVITGGVDTLNDIFMYMCFSKTPALSAKGDVRPFSDEADGTMLGEGVGMVALKRLDDAERDGDRVYAVIKGVGTSSDGRAKSVYAPVSVGQSNAITRAYERAGFEPHTVELIEAHGTGTKAGDVAEFGGLKLAFDSENESRTQWCALGSVKSQIGHTKAAAGAAGLFKAVMALHHKALPPTAKVDRPNPKLQVESSPFYINAQARPWIRSADHPRRAGVSSFGFGGSNFHVAAEEYTGKNPAARLRTLPFEMVVAVGNDGAEVATLAETLASRATDPGMLQRLAWETQRHYDGTAKARLAVIAADESELADRLRRAAARIAKSPAEPFEMPDGTQFGVGAAAGEVAFIFPGQGAQYVNMGAHLAMSFGEALEPWDASAEIDFGVEERLHDVVFPIPRFSDGDRKADEQRLRQTEWAQPAIGCTSLSYLAIMNTLEVSPSAVAGHSFGEVTALHAAGALSLEDYIKVARKRGELMAAAANAPGAMTAVSEGVGVIDEILKALAREDVVIANHNAPNQAVISGSAEGVRAVESELKARKIKFEPLAVSAAFH
ncbi:MAG: acyltransferase domain-containing protein, partial [Myxococcota bacterium]